MVATYLSERGIVAHPDVALSFVRVLSKSGKTLDVEPPRALATYAGSPWFFELQLLITRGYAKGRTAATVLRMSREAAERA